ncbi:MAG: DUF692 family multinuclear iron-containing protein [Planctomycetota bacterium]
MNPVDGVPCLGAGLAFQSPYLDELVRGEGDVSWLEIIPETSMDRGGRIHRAVRDLAGRYPVALHGLAMNLGSTDPLDFGYLEALKVFARDLGARWISDHLCFSGVGDRYYAQAFPLPHTEEAISHLVSRIRVVQDYLQLPFLVENVSSYFEHEVDGSLSEEEFVSRVVGDADCGLLLDLSSVHVNAHNHGFDAADHLNRLPFSRVGQIHLGGHAERDNLVLNIHGSPVSDAVWSLFETAVGLLERPVLLERDHEIPPLDALLPELRRVSRVIHSRFPGGGT